MHPSSLLEDGGRSCNRIVTLAYYLFREWARLKENTVVIINHLCKRLIQLLPCDVYHITVNYVSVLYAK
jgi:hypothetical protein